LKTPSKPSSPIGVPERRYYPRQKVQSFAYANVGRSRGVVSDISERGLGVKAADSEIEPQICTVTFSFPGSQECVKIKGQIAWLSESRREAGMKFIDPPETARRSIQEWMSIESSPGALQHEGTIGRPQLHPLPQSYHIAEIRSDADLNRFVKIWRERQRQFPGHALHCDPEWLALRFKREKENIRIFLLERADEIIGVVPFVVNREHLVCELGKLTLAKFPMRILRLQIYTLNMLEEEAAYDQVIGQILRSDVDAIYMENVKTSSFLWKYLRSSPLMRREFQFYSKSGPLPHCLTRLNGTFESYIKKFSAKTRKNRFRELRTLRERGEVTLVRVSESSEVDAFLEAACSISQRTWQFKRLGVSLAARDRVNLKRELEFLADHRWLRSYLLKCDGVPCSFILGHQYGPSFYAESVGVDDAWRSYSVGTVTLLLVLENLFKENPPAFYDFGPPLRFHKYFATESYPEARVWLFRRRPYLLLTSSIYRACNAVSVNAGMLLDHFGLKSRLKHVLSKRG
jgi:hypothetical protein